jgi:hypothetical protein
VTRRFIDYCDNYRILLLIFPPHATHTLQPLDVACFKSLSQNYTKELVKHNHFTEGWIPLSKRDFMSLFWPAWVDTFTEKLVLSAFASTGINPPDADVILDRFMKPPPLPTPSPPATPPAQTEPQPALSEPNWLRCKSDLNRAVKYGDVEAANSVIQQVHQYHVLNELKDHQIQGFKDAAEAKKRRNKKKKVLPLSPRDPNVQGGATFFDSSAVARANHCMRVKEKEHLEAEAAKVTKKQLEFNNKLLKAKQQADAMKKRLEDAEKTAQKKAQEQAEKDAQKAERLAARELKDDAQKASSRPKWARSKASAKSQSKVPKRSGGAGRRRPQVVHERSSAPPLRKPGSGHVIRPTRKLR